MFDDLERQGQGKPIRAATINQVVVGAEWLAKLSVAPPLALLDVPGGRCLHLQQEGVPFPAFIYGSSSPYDFEEAYETEGGGYEVLPGGRTGQAIEVNGVPNLGT